jgi:uncharacterized protein (DUF2252 family)
VPIRIGRMIASPFAFYRGSADLMAIDLGRRRRPGSSCNSHGDPTVNFGVYCLA